MEQEIKKIISINIDLFGKNPNVEKINVGFTNTIFNVNNKYIIKICTNYKNEESFKKEIYFYISNKDNNLIPKLYKYNIDKKETKYMYIILEKIEGTSLYNIWHTLTELERENIIKQLCEAMKLFHKNKGNKYNWQKKINNKYLELYEQANKLKLFNIEEQNILNNAYKKFNKYLKTDKIILIHNDLHFDNIFYNKGKIKLIDFERSMYAPIDYELDIIYRMIRKPWKYASEETEKYINENDYKNIMFYIEKYYPELVNINYLYKRLAIYDIIYFIKQLINNPIDELKKDVINAAYIVIND